MEKKTMMAAAGLTAATMAVAAGVAAGSKGKNTRKMKKMAKKVAPSVRCWIWIRWSAGIIIDDQK